MAIPTPITPRLTSAYISQPLSYRFPLEGRQEPLEPGLVWDEIRLFADVREKSEKIFTGTRSEQRARWQALNDFARQARSYSDALEVTRGTSRGLLGYYSALNLAKAELLHSNPVGLEYWIVGLTCWFGCPWWSFCNLILAGEPAEGQPHPVDGPVVHPGDLSAQHGVLMP